MAPSIFVGRLTELERLEEAFARSQGGERQIVCVTGDAGLGKTTLVQAFLALVADAEPVRVAQGRCIEHHGAGEAYLPVLEALGRLAREPGGEGLVRLLAGRAPTWLVQLPGLVPPAQIAGLRQEVIGTTRERMLREMIDLVDELASERPLVVVLEDMHWSDYSTLDLLTALAHRPDPARLLVIATYRPGDALTAGHPLHHAVQELRLRGHAREIALQPLAEPALADYIRSRFPDGDLPNELPASLLSLTGGNPLFVETLVGSWVSDGHVVDDSGVWRLEAGLGHLAEGTPESLRVLIEQQLLRLDGQDLAVLEGGAVAGLEFAAAAAAAALEQDDEDVEERLDALARRGRFVAPAGPVDWPDGTICESYRFTHDLFPEVLYGRIAAGRRARLHRRLGARLEAAFRDDHAPVAVELAGHFLAGRDVARAVEHLELAAVQALDRSAPRDAIEHLGSALDELARLPGGDDRDRCELRLQLLLGPTVIAVEGWSSPRAEAAYVRAQELAENLDDVDRLRTVLYRLAEIHEVRGHYLVAEALTSRCLSLQPSASSLLVDSHELMACSLFHQGRHGAALDHAQEGIGASGEARGESLNAVYGENPVVTCHTWAALTLWFLGLPDRARDRAHHAVTIADEPARAHGRSTARAHTALIHQLRREPEHVSAWADEAVSIGEAQGFVYRVAMGRVLRGWATAFRGRPHDGVAELRAGLELSRRTGARMDDAHYLGLLAEALGQAGEYAEGLGAIDEALSLITVERQFFYESELHRLRALLLLRSEPDGIGEAHESLLRALEVAESQGSPSLALRAAVALAKLDAGSCDASARERVGALYARFEEGFETPDLQEAAALLELAGTG